MPNVLLTNMIASGGGGAKVLKKCIIASKMRMPGDVITKQEFLSILPANRNALINKEYLSVFPEDPMDTSRFVALRSDGKYDVVVGKKITDKPVDLEEARRIADKHNITEALEKHMTQENISSTPVKRKAI